MKNIRFNNCLNRVLVLFLALSYTFINAQVRPGPPGNGGGGATGPGRRPPRTHIDMYEAGLLLLAILLIVGYYFYTRNRKVA